MGAGNPYGLVDSDIADLVLRSRAVFEEHQIDRIRMLASRLWTVPWRAEF